MNEKASGWRDRILSEFDGNAVPLTLVVDPDGLVTEEGVLETLQARGFEVISYEDPVAFRFAYESKHRERLDRGDLTGLVVVRQAPGASLCDFPYDLLQQGRRLSFSLAELFPNLSYPVVSALDRSELDILYAAQQRYNPETLGDTATKDFILRHVFGVVAELVREPEELLCLLLRRHYQGRRVPKTLDERFIQVLRSEGRFNEWPLEEIIPRREAFFAFLQERWPVFLDHLVRGMDEHREASAFYDLQYPGPLELPFDHGDVRVYVDNLFTEGHLTPVSHPKAGMLSSQWVAVGLKTDPAASWRRRLHDLLAVVEKALPERDARYQEWLAFARKWAELTVLRYEGGPEGDRAGRERFESLRCAIDGRFSTWMLKRYAGLHNQPATPPVMLHHIPRHLARAVQERRVKVALVVVDGLAFDQWLVARSIICECWPGFRFHDGAVFAWVPTLTSFSRQALLAGKPPLFFPGSLYTTDREHLLWTLFWSDQGVERGAVAYANVVGDEDLGEVAEALESPKIRVGGVVVRKVDKIMHGMELGAAGMHTLVRQWAKEGHLARLFGLLLEQGFEVYLTSDHGNIEAHGCGVPAEGAVADLRGARARIYPDPLLRKRVKERFPDAIEWLPTGLPGDCLPLLAPGRLAFLREGERVVCHGGISLEEVIVPLVRVERITGRSL